MRFAAAALICGWVGFAVAARAQSADSAEVSSFPIERFRLSADRNGIADVESGAVRDHLSVDAALSASYMLNPLVLKNGGRRTLSLVQHRLGGELVASIALFDWVQLGAALPYLVFQTRDTGAVVSAISSARDLGAVGLGDVRLIPKVRILRAADQVVDLAIIPTLTLPSALTNAGLGGSYAGEGQVTFAPELALSKPLGALRLAANLGYRLRPEERRVLNLVVGHELFYRAGAAYSFEERNGVPLDVGVTLSGATYAFQPFSSGFEENPLEGILHVAWWPLPFLQVYGGVGGGIIAGFGAPDARVIAGVRYSTPNGPKDRDGDGILDDADVCPDAPEDADGFEDADGCPDPDNDGDGVLDAEDACRDQPGVLTYQGCPDPDLDDDGVLDPDDECVSVPGLAELKGCPDLDADDDGVLDDADRCVNVPGLVELKGCPDQDADGIADLDDLCPTEPETRNGVEDDDGCPEKTKSVVIVRGDKIEILEKVYFDTGKTTIQKRSFDLLDKVARVLETNPQIGRVRVEGHTDSRGSDDANMRLSQGRADAVRAYLIDKGIDPARLVARGYGETRPIAPNDTKANLEKNRRVEFQILEMNGKPLASDDGAAGGAP